MQDIVKKALALWGVPSATFKLIAARENSVFQITHGTEIFALRLHRTGYRTDQELSSELQWMAVAAASNIKVPTPIPTLEGDLLVTVDGIQIDALNWLPGLPLSEIVSTLDTQERVSLFHNIGTEMARLHDVSDAWSPSQNFTRCAWDREGLLGVQPLWNRFWENPFLTEKEQSLLLQFREVANEVLGNCEASLDYGLIHADLVGNNVMVDKGNVSFIDFDDGGFGFRLFEIATALHKFTEEADFPELQNALIQGYKSVRPISLDQLNLFFALRAVSYVGWNITRINESDGASRNERFIRTAIKRVEAFLNTQT